MPYIWPFDRVPRPVLQERRDVRVVGHQVGVHRRHVAAVDQPQGGVAGGRHPVVLAGLHQRDHLVRGVADLHVDLAAGLLLERRDPVDGLVVGAVLGVPGPGDDVELRPRRRRRGCCAAMLGGAAAPAGPGRRATSSRSRRTPPPAASTAAADRRGPTIVRLSMSTPASCPAQRRAAPRSPAGAGAASGQPERVLASPGQPHAVAAARPPAAAARRSAAAATIRAPASRSTMSRVVGAGVDDLGDHAVGRRARPARPASPGRTTRIFSGRTHEGAVRAEQRAARPGRPAGWRCRRSRRRTRWPGARRPRAGVPTCSIRPPLKTAIRSLMVSASSWSWVTNTKVMPTSRWIDLSSTCISSRSLRSSAPSGSSSSSTFGRLTSARASATRCRWPPESCAGPALRRSPPSRTVASASSAARGAARPWPTLRTRRPYSTFVATRHVREQRVVLEDRVDVALERRQPGDVVAVEQDAARGRQLEAGDHPQHGRLARAGRARASRRTRRRRRRGRSPSTATTGPAADGKTFRTPRSETPTDRPPPATRAGRPYPARCPGERYWLRDRRSSTDSAGIMAAGSAFRRSAGRDGRSGSATRLPSGSPSSGANASSAAPSRLESAPSPGSSSRTWSRGAVSAAASSARTYGSSTGNSVAGQAAEHDHLGVEQVDQVGHADPEPAADPADRGLRRPAAAARSRRGSPPASTRPARRSARSTASAPTSVSQQPRRPQRAQPAGAGVDAHVPDLAGVPAGAGERPPADDHPAAQADLAGQVDRVGGVRRRPRAGARPSPRGRPRCRPRPAACCAAAAPSSSPSGTSTQPRFGASRTSWPGPPTMPGTATPMPTGSVPAAASSGSTSARTRSSTCTHGAARRAAAGSPGGRAPRRRGRPGPRTGARRRCRRASAQTASERGSTRIDGRPAPPRPTGAASRTRPASASSVVSARTVLRFSPLTAVSSARDAAPADVQQAAAARRGCAGGPPPG